ncbi:hypothetical protein [Paenibacillus hamazuiensis]|uniref:hypothetical protein n=1 Tax=Paenibacillus hamazuiensis TaxID=2936508 RepID=UPI00200E50FB|nr:hypothetical protein [Paenibacillus hamazuiensis]
MVKTIGCLHAHHNNIPGIERTLGSDYRLVHYVDPGFIPWLNGKERQQHELRIYMERQLEWIGGYPADAILLTCTNYIAAMDEVRPRTPCPVAAIDEPFMTSLFESEGPVRILFTNPATVQGTMRRLRMFADRRGVRPDVEASVIERSFELFMEGKEGEYLELVAEHIRRQPASRLAVGQLSMTAAAERIERETGRRIEHPLKELKNHMDRLMGKTDPSP